MVILNTLVDILHGMYIYARIKPLHLWCLQKAGSEVRNRDWNFDQKGTLELRGDDAVQTRQRELRTERQKEYNTFMSQVQPVGVLCLVNVTYRTSC